MSRDTGIDELVARQLRAIDTLERVGNKLTEVGELVRGLSVNHVLFSGSLAIADGGVASLDFSIPMAAVLVVNSRTAGLVTVVAATPQASPGPAAGKGVWEVRAGAALVIPLTGTALTFYGPVGATVIGVAVYSSPVPPMAHLPAP